MSNSDRERPRGILTEKDRRYLMDDVLPDSKQARYERKKGVQERIRNGILDFPYLRFMPPKERRGLFTDMDTHDELYWALKSIIGFAKYACDDAGIPVKKLLEDGLELGTFSARGDVSDPSDHRPREETDGTQTTTRVLDSVTVDIEYNFFDMYSPEEVKRRFENGENLSLGEIGTLVVNGHLDEEDLQKLEEEPVEEKRF